MERAGLRSLSVISSSVSSLVIVRMVVVVVNRDGIVDDVDDVGVTPVWLDSAANAMVIVHHWKVINMFGRV